MALNPLVLNDCRIYYDSADLTGFSNKFTVAAAAANLDKTTFASGGWREIAAGVFDGNGSVEGFYQAGDLTMPDDNFWATLGDSSVAISAVPTAGTVGSVTYLTQGIECDYTPGAKHGELLGYVSNFKTNWPILRGQVMHPQGTARTATGNGTGLQLGAVSANQAFYVNLHAMGYVDGSMTVVVQSSVDNTFGAPTTRATFTAVAALGGQQIRVPGAITDTWWRVTWTISGGVTHSFLFAATAGIGPK
jgi:hypothetical protein